MDLPRQKTRDYIKSETAYHSLMLSTDLDELRDEWKEFEENAYSTVFQSYDWISSWCRTAAPRLREEPVFIRAYDKDGALSFLWPMSITRVLGIYTLGWLGQAHSNYNFGLYRPDSIHEIDQAVLRSTLHQIRQATPKIDAVRLINQPLEWDNVKNPFSHFPIEPNPESGFALDLQSEYELLYKRRFSSRTRQNHRSKERKLSRFGNLNLGSATKVEHRLALLDTFFNQKNSQLADLNQQSVFSDRVIQEFYRDIIAQEIRDPEFAFEQMFVTLNDQVLSTLSGIRFQNRFYFLTISMDKGPNARLSPGLMLLRQCIRQCCDRGVNVFDLGPGRHDYKDAWDPVELSLFDTNLGLNSRGHIAAAAYRARNHLKLAAKRNLFLLRAARTIKSILNSSR